MAGERSRIFRGWHFLSRNRIIEEDDAEDNMEDNGEVYMGD